MFNVDSLFVGGFCEDGQPFGDRAEALQEDAPELQPSERGEGGAEGVQPPAGSRGHLNRGRERA